MLLGHAFEMLLKAVIYQERGNIQNVGDSKNYGFTRTINIAYSDLQLINEDDRTVLENIKKFRDIATHDTVAIGDDLLWLHIRSAVTVFSRVLKRQFNSDLTDLVPARVVPIAALPPSDPVAIIERELQDIKGFLAPNTRRGDEAKARLRLLLALDGSVTGREEIPADTEVDRVVKQLRAGHDWEGVFPGLTRLTLSATPTPGSQEISLRVERSDHGIPVRGAAPDQPALAYQVRNTFQEFNIKLSKFGEKLGLNQQEGYALIWHLKLKDDQRAYFIETTERGNVRYQGLSARAIYLGRRALDQGLDIETVKKQYYKRKCKSK